MLFDDEKQNLESVVEENAFGEEEPKPAQPLGAAPAETPAETPAEAPNEEAPAIEVPNEAPVVEEQAEEENNNEWAELKNVIDGHFTILKNMLRSIKTKDANVSSLSIEITKYREGFSTSLFKSLALSLIPYREECLKAIRDLAARDFSEDDAKKYIDYISADYEDFLYNIKLEKSGDKWLYNHKDIEEEPKAVSFEAPQEYNLPDFEDKEVNSVEDLLAYLKAVEAYVEQVLANNTEQDKLLAKYIAQSSLYEQGINQVVLYPVIRKIIMLGNYINSQTEIINEHHEYTKYRYFAFQEGIASIVADILSMCEVKILATGDNFDPRYHRAIKFTATEDENLIGKIAAKYSDCYVFGNEEKVIYPQKVDLYRK